MDSWRISVRDSGLHRGGRSGHEVGRVGRGVVEGDVLPDVERLAQRRARLGGMCQNLSDLRATYRVLRCGPRSWPRAPRGWPWRQPGCPSGGRSCRRQTEGRRRRPGGQELVHLAGVNAARGDRHQFLEGGPGLIEEQPVLEPPRNKVLAAGIVMPLVVVRIAFELADDGARMNVVDARHTHPFRDDPERHAVDFWRV